MNLCVQLSKVSSSRFSEHLTLLHATLRDLLSRKDNLERLFQSSYG